MEERDHETTDPGVQITAAPKARGSMKVLVIVLAALVLLVGAGFLAFSLLRSGPQVRYISGEALAVAKIDLPKMLLKAGIDKDIKNSNKELWELLRELDMEALVEDPKSSGLLTAKPAYAFVDYVQKDENAGFCLVVPLSSGKKFTEFIEKSQIGDEYKIKKRGDYHVIDEDEGAAIWSNNTLMVGFYGTDSGIDPVKRMTSLLEQPKSASIASNAEFKKSFSPNHDLSLWLNVDTAAAVARTGLKDAKPKVAKLIEKRGASEERAYASRSYYDREDYDFDDYYEDSDSNYYAGDYDDEEDDWAYPDNIFESFLLDYDAIYQNLDDFLDKLAMLDGSAIQLYMDFNKGEIEFGSDQMVGKEAVALYKSIFGDLGGFDELTAYLPGENNFFVAALHYKYPKLWDLFRKQAEELFVESFDDPDTQKMLKYASELFDGTVLISMSEPEKGDDPVLTIVASARENKGLKEILKMMEETEDIEKEGNDYLISDGYLILKNDAYIFTFDKEYYQKAKLGLDPATKAGLKTIPLAAKLDVDKLLESTGRQMDREGKRLLGYLKEVSIASSSPKGIPTHTEIKIKLSNTKQNSLKTIMEVIQDEGLLDYLS